MRAYARTKGRVLQSPTIVRAKVIILQQGCHAVKPHACFSCVQPACAAQSRRLLRQILCPTTFSADVPQLSDASRPEPIHGARVCIAAGA